MWLGVIAALNLGVEIGASMLSGVDYGAFSTFFEANKRVFFCLGANLFFISMLAPSVGLAQSLGRDIAAVLTGIHQTKRWKTAVRRFVTFLVVSLVVLLAFAQIVMMNVNLLPHHPLVRGGVWVLLAGVAVFGWKFFRRAGRQAGYRFNEALAAEKRRARRRKTADDAKSVTLTVPGDYYALLKIAPGSPAVGETIKSLDIRAKTGASVVAVRRGADLFRNPGASWCFEPDDEARVIGDPDQLAALRRMFDVPQPDGTKG